MGNGDDPSTKIGALDGTIVRRSSVGGDVRNSDALVGGDVGNPLDGTIVVGSNVGGDVRNSDGTIVGTAVLLLTATRVLNNGCAIWASISFFTLIEYKTSQRSCILN